MANWDSADLLARFKRITNRPTLDESLTDAQIYDYLTEAEIKVADLIAVHVPESQYGAPQKLTTSDDGETYSFPSSINPMGAVEIKPSKTGEPLVEVAEWDCGAHGFVRQQNVIRWPCQKKRTFADGPWARFMTPPAGISATSEPSLVPAEINILVLYKAAAMWAKRGGLRDPRPYETQFSNLAWGDPEQPGDVGMIGRLKLQYGHMGHQAYSGGGKWWRNISDGAGYQPDVG
jgi:hypothetical protein